MHGVERQFLSLEKRLKYHAFPRALCLVSMRSLLECELPPQLQPLSFLLGKLACAVGMQSWEGLGEGAVARPFTHPYGSVRG